jgi:hypothetical protein
MIHPLARMFRRPYTSELTYKHPYWFEENYKKEWDKWAASGFVGDEPMPTRNLQFWHASKDDQIDPDVIDVV